MNQNVLDIFLAPKMTVHVSELFLLSVCIHALNDNRCEIKSCNYVKYLSLYTD